MAGDGRDEDEGVPRRQGFFRDALPGLRAQYLADGRKISVLRIDGNYYDSYMEVLFNLYELVPIGGYVIFDDWSFPVVRQALADFAAMFSVLEYPAWVQFPDDLRGVFFRKTATITVDRSVMPAPPGI